jgi:hypothetical protein
MSVTNSDDNNYGTDDYHYDTVNNTIHYNLYPEDGSGSYFDVRLLVRNLLISHEKQRRRGQF